MPNAPPPNALRVQDFKRLLQNPFDRCEWERCSSTHLCVRIGNRNATRSKQDALDQLATFFSRLIGFAGPYCEVWTRRRDIFIETHVHFLTGRGQPSELPCMIVARIRGGLLMDLRFYLDPCPIP